MIVVSECLLGINCKYNGENNANKALIKLAGKICVIPVCPEQLGGLPTPRTPAEIIGNNVINKKGEDVSDNFHKGAKEALKIVNLVNPKIIILKANSPSCGYKKIYDGTFSGKIIDGNGVFAQNLIDNGYNNIITENDINQDVIKKITRENER